METIELRGVELAYEYGGAGVPLIWGHGLSQSIAREDELGLIDWPAIRRHASVLRYDARGHGESGSSADAEGYHWRDLALDQLALADALGIESFIAGGASMGCATALHAAVLAPQRVQALLLVIPPTAWQTRADQQAGYEVIARMVEAGRVDLILAGARSLPVPDPLAGVPAWSASFEATVRDTDPVRLARVFRGAAMADLPSPAQVATLKMPVLILAWTGDPGHPVSTTQRLGQLMPHATVHIASTHDELLRWTGLAADFVCSV
jgi:pimeloyl-ACP methyl ester carboxylesterase